MALQYISDNLGVHTAVIIPINDWNYITEKYSDIEDIPEWEKAMTDQRLDFIKNHSDKLIPIEEFIAELDKDDEV